MNGEKKNFENMYDTSTIDNKLENDKEVQEAIENGEYFEEFSQEDYQNFYNEQHSSAQEQLIEFEKQQGRKFDELVEKYKVLVGLRGESYRDVTKMMFYCIFANQLKYNFFTMDDKKLDLRLPVLLMIKSGHGKKNYEYFCKKTIEGLGKTYTEPTSYHPEQFVGKVIEREDKDGDVSYQEIRGAFDADFIIIDEGHRLLTDKKNEECLSYIRTALDPIGSNTIEKKQVNVPKEFALKYEPNCTICIFTQPITDVNEELLIRGSFRRFLILMCDTTLDERMNARRESEIFTAKEDVYSKMWERWNIINNKLLNFRNTQFVGKKEDFTLIDDYLDKIGKRAEYRSKTVLEYYNTSQFTIKQILFKMCVIRACVEYPVALVKDEISVVITQNHIKSVINDFHRIWQPQVVWISQQMEIKSDLPKQWKDDKHGFIMRMIGKNKVERSILVQKLFDDRKGKLSKNSADVIVGKYLKQLLSWDYIKEDHGKDNKKTYYINPSLSPIIYSQIDYDS